MAKTNFNTVEDYLAAQPEGARASLELVRAAVLRALPTAEEVISYQIPTFKIDGKAILSIGGWKKHYSLYPATEAVAAALEGATAPYELEKCTLRFPLSAPVPEALVEQIACIRSAEVATEQQAKDHR